MQNSSDFLATTSCLKCYGVTQSSGTRAVMTLIELQADSEALSRQRDAAKSSSGTKLPPTNRVMPLYMTPLVNDGISVGESMTTMERMGQQEQLFSTRICELEKAVHFEQENLWKELVRNQQEISPSQKLITKWTDDYLILRPQNRPHAEDEKRTESK